jgi:hypothetical protein
MGPKYPEGITPKTFTYVRTWNKIILRFKKQIFPFYSSLWFLNRRRYRGAAKEWNKGQQEKKEE